VAISKRFRKLIGDKAFYAMVLSISVPIMVQNGITNFVSLLDNLMVGQLGTEQMSGVSIVNQVLFVFNLCIFGAVSGAGIFCAQFYGSGNHEGIRDAFRFKVLICLVICAIGLGAFLSLGDTFIGMFLHEGSEGGDLMLTLESGRAYLKVMLLGLAFFAVKESYASTLREMGQTLLPMKAGIAAVLVNLVLNYVFIFGKLGLPAMGVVGAGLATVVSRIAECLIVVIWTHKNSEICPFIRGAYKHFRIPLSLCRQITVKGMPLLINEGLWSLAMTILMQCYSVRGLAVVAGLNITSTINNLFSIVFMSLGSAVAIITGRLLGASKYDEAQESVSRLLALSVGIAVAIGAVVALLSPLFPLLYNTTDEVRALAAKFILIAACTMPVHSFNHASYFALRSGGKTLITFLFDGVYVWLISVPAAFCLSRLTDMPIVPLYAIVQSLDLLKSAVGYLFIKKGVWVNNIVS